MFVRGQRVCSSVGTKKACSSCHHWDGVEEQLNFVRENAIGVETGSAKSAVPSSGELAQL